MRTTLQRRAAAAVAALAALMTAAPADASAGERATLAMPFTETVAGRSTGLEIAVRYMAPDDPDAKPPAITRAEFELPAGTALDLGAVPACTATDHELQLRGRDACPVGSRVGTGELVAITGFGAPIDPVHADVTIFNGRGELIELVTFAGTNVYAGSDRLTVEGTTLRANPPVVPGGPPDGRTAVREIRVSIPARTGAAGRPYLTTPSACPIDCGAARGASASVTAARRSSPRSSAAADARRRPRRREARTAAGTARARRRLPARWRPPARRERPDGCGCALSRARSPPAGRPASVCAWGRRPSAVATA
jgi:hypothetical protein